MEATYMTRLLLVLMIAVTAVSAVIGCSGDQAVDPRQDGKAGARLLSPSVVIGPSELVLCVDVSDSVSAGELESVVSALGGCLSNQSLIPQDGMVTVAIVVYADTVATVLDRTPVTSGNLENAILPTLQGLLTNRVVPTSGFDLSGALEKALAILGSATVSDRHVLVVGSGAADDAAAVGTSCGNLAGAGVRVSALAVGADGAGAALLKSCADTTGGFYGAIDAGCGEALAYMLQVEIDLEPETAELARGADHTVTAAVFRGGDPEAYPVVGAEVIITVVDGPNAAVADTAMTDASGKVALTYTGDGGPGTDIVVALAAHPGTGLTMTDTVTVTWLNAQPVCSAGGPYTVVVTEDTARVTLDAGASSDADGDPLAFRWSPLCEDGAALDDDRLVSPVLTLTGECLCVDSLVVALTVSDGFDSTTCEAVVRIDDQRPPVIVMREDPYLVWPPNHKYQKVTPQMMIVSAEDACGNPIDLSTALVVEVRSNEPDDATGDGSTVNDIRVACPNNVKLRAERMGGGDGRMYTIVYRIFSENGVSADGEGLVLVPHDSSGKKAPDDSHTAYTVTTDCGNDN
jgi:hypothetical protein